MKVLKSWYKRLVAWHKKWEDSLAVKCKDCKMSQKDILHCTIAWHHPRVAKCMEFLEETEFSEEEE